MTRAARFFAIWLLSAALSWSAYAAETIHLDGVASASSLGPASANLPDPEGNLAFEDALRLYRGGAFSQVEASHFDPGYSTTPHWVVTRLRNEAAEDTRYRVLTNLPFVPAISIYLERQGGVREVLLERRLDTPWRADQFLSFAVATGEFALAPGEDALLVTRFHPYGVGILPMSVETVLSAQQRAADAAFQRAAFYGFALTSLLMLTLYVFAIWRTDGIGIIATTFSGVLMMAQIDGLLYAYLWPGAPGWNKVASFPLLMLLCASMLYLAHTTYRAAQRPRLARLVGALALGCFAIIPLMMVIKAATLILVGFAMLIVALTMLSFASIGMIRLFPSRSLIALAVAAFVFIAVSFLLTNVVLGSSDIGAQNLIMSKIVYALMTMIFIASYAAQASGLARLEARFVKRELAQARAAAQTSAALLEAERKYFDAKEAEIRQTQRLEDVSHDLRQPITALKSTLAPLVKGEQGKGIQSAVDYLDSLVSEKLAGDPNEAQEETGEERVESLPASLLIDAAVEMFRRRAEEKGLKLRGRACGGDVTAQPVPLMRILNNLVSNAVEHAEKGGVLVSARRRRDHMLIEVYDTGPGMTEKQIRSFTNRRRKSEESEGDGLGLAICFKLSQRYDFALRIKSRPGRGSAFSLEVPIDHRAMSSSG